MKKKFLNYECALMAAVAIIVYLGHGKYHFSTSIGEAKTLLYIDVFVDSNEVLELPDSYLYSSCVREKFVTYCHSEDCDCITFYFDY